MAVMKQMTIKDLEPALEQCAKYYRNDSVLTAMGNCGDAYNFYKEEFKDDFECYIKNGLCYTYKKNYLIACDPKDLEKNNPDIYKHCFNIMPEVYSYMQRERNHVLFITDFGPSNGEFLTKDFYELLNQFDKKYKDCSILTMAPAIIDWDNMTKFTRSQRISISELPAWRWS
jgi:hypothetical protein